MDIQKLIKENRGAIVDVRSYDEFAGGHVVGSINIPLTEIPQRMEEIQQLKMPLVLCCASGNRSGQVQYFLLQHGIECYNGGSWQDVNYQQSN